MSFIIQLHATCSCNRLVKENSRCFFFPFMIRLMMQFYPPNPCPTTFLPFSTISQMGFDSKGHTSWKTDGLKRHQGHCGHNESAYVCNFTVLFLSFFFFPILQITGATICICQLMDMWGMLLNA